MKKCCHDKVMNVTTLNDKVSGPYRETKLRQVMLTCVAKEFNVVTYFKAEKRFRCRDWDLKVATQK